jgi:hypothetical protein
MPKPKPIEPYYFQANLIWWNGRFNVHYMQNNNWASLSEVKILCILFETTSTYGFQADLI